MQARVVESARGANGSYVPRHCRLSGTVRSVDDRAPDIRFEVAMPFGWNGKALMLGGGGFNGTIPDVTAPRMAGIGPNGPIVNPLRRGYVTFASDSGHQIGNQEMRNPAVDGGFLVHDEALRNYAGDALKKTRDAVTQLVARYYGRAPERLYFRGGSNGGREALAYIQRWPADLDGAIALYPFWNGGTTALAMGVLGRAMAAPGGYLGEPQMKLLYDSVMQTCDSLDGLVDGLISNVGACEFDVGSLRCTEGASVSSDCLTASQIATLETFDSKVEFPHRAGRGVASYPGFEVFAGADMRPWFAGRTQPAFPSTPDMPDTFHFWDQLVRFGVAREATTDSLSLDPVAPGLLEPRLNEVVDMLNASVTDLSPFAARGGKLIIYHGLADVVLSHRATVEYWEHLNATMGRESVEAFARYYEVPGQGHGVGAFLPVWDELGALEAWVEHGVSPTDPIVRDAGNAGNGRQRPLCRYPTWPRYDGEGAVGEAFNFQCVGGE
jgi:feruloyl esterase